MPISKVRRRKLAGDERALDRKFNQSCAKTSYDSGFRLSSAPAGLKSRHRTRATSTITLGMWSQPTWRNTIDCNLRSQKSSYLGSQLSDNGNRSTVLDALRAVAILLVLGRHTRVAEVWTRVGWCGVDLFFVISGFLISGLLFQEYKRFGEISLKRFWLRRGLKIYPAFYVYTLILTIVLPITIPGAKVPVRPLLADLTFLSCYFPGLSGQTWSLAVEEHFYLLLPLFLLALMKVMAMKKMARKKETPFASIPVVFVLIAIGSLGLRMAATPAYARDYYSYLFPTHLRMDGLFCGVTIGYFYHFKPQLLARIPGWRLLFAASILLIPIYFLNLESWHMYTWGLSTTFLGFGCLVTWAARVRLASGRLLAFPVHLLARIGFYSYSIYLWHWMVIGYFRQYLRYKCITTGTPFAWSPQMENLQWSLSMGFSIVIGITMAVLVEQPVLKFRDRWLPSRTRPTADTADPPPETSRSDSPAKSMSANA